MEVFRNCYIILMLFANLILVLGSNSAPNNDTRSTYEAAKKKFSKLLTAIADLNEKKLIALQKYTDLEQNNPVDGILRDIEYKNKEYLDEIIKFNNNNSKDFSEKTLHDMICIDDKRKPSALWLYNTLKLLRAYKDVIIKTNDNKNNIKTNTAHLIAKNKLTRRERDINNINGREFPLNFFEADVIDEFLRASCSRSSSNSKCKDVCTSSISEICYEYECSTRMKNDFKYICKGKCDDKFY